MRPRLLDLFCGAGGATRGYQEAGFDVVGVDIAPQPHYCGDEFVQDDAMEILGSVAAGFERWIPEDIEKHLRLDVFDAIHASPPCQAYSPLNGFNKKTYPDLVAAVRGGLIETGLPYVIENVPQAPLHAPTILCGQSFGLRVYRHRGFETNFPVMSSPHAAHEAECVRNGYLPNDEQFMSIHGGRHSKAWRERAAEAMGVPWMKTIREVCEAIPPAYTAHIGSYLFAHIEVNAELAP